MANIIPFPEARDDADAHQVALIRILDRVRHFDNAADALAYQGQVLDRLAAAYQERLGAVLARTLRDSARSLLAVAAILRQANDETQVDAWSAMEAGERFHLHHKTMVEEVRRLRRQG